MPDAGQFWGPEVVIRVTEEDVAELLDCLLSCIEHVRRTSASAAVVARARCLVGRITEADDE